MGAGKTTAAQAFARHRRGRGRRRRRDRGAARDADRGDVRAGRRGRVPRDRGAGHARAARRPGRSSVVALGGGALGSARVREALARAPGDLARRRRRDRLAAVRGEQRPSAGVRPGAASTGCTPSASRSTRALADVVVPATALDGRPQVLRRARRRARRGTDAVGDERVGRLPGLHRRRACSTEHRRSGRRRSTGRRLLVTDGHAGRLYGERLEPLARRRSRSCPASSPRRSRTPRSCGPSWSAAG